MQLRLAFSVAAHLEPEILLIDEVLAVGDMEFQKKCLGKMEEVSKSDGRTILFVSHNLSFISGLCNSAILLNNGSLVKSGKTSDVVSEYIGSIVKQPVHNGWEENPPGNEIVVLRGIRAINLQGESFESFNVNE